MDYQEYVELREYFVKLIEEKNLKELKQVVSEMNVVDVAEVIEDLEDKQMLLVFRMLPKDMGSDVFSYMEDVYKRQHLKDTVVTEDKLEEMAKMTIEHKKRNIRGFIELDEEAVHEILRKSF